METAAHGAASPNPFDLLIGQPVKKEELWWPFTVRPLPPLRRY
jgi:hypothetical protein